MSTELWEAMKAGDAGAVERLLDDGADPNWADGEGRTPLMAAARRGHAAICRLLIERGAEVDAAASHGQTPLFLAVMQGDGETVKLLLDARADPNGASSESGFTPLIWSSTLGRTDLIELLLDAGADLAVRDGTGYTALFSAVMNGHLEAASLLLDRGADPEVQANSITPLAFATGLKNRPMVELLLERGASTRPEGSPVHLSVMTFQEPELAELFHRAEGTDLHEAAKAGDVQQVRTLLSGGRTADHGARAAARH